MLGSIIGADVGNQDSKFYSHGKSFVVPSYACRERIRELDNVKEEYHIKISNEMWWTGELAKLEYGTREIEKNKLMRDSNLPLILTGISLMVENESLVSVVGSTPISDYSDTTLSLRDILRSVWNIEFCGKHKKLHVVDVLMMPEGASVGYALVLDDNGRVHSKPELLRIIDIGSKTVNFCTFRRMKYIAAESGTLPFGTTSAQLETYRRVASRSDIMPDDATPDDEARHNLSIRIRSEINKWWKTNWDEVHLAGGGALMLQDHLDFPLVSNPQLATAIGNYRVGVAKWTTTQL